MIFSRFFCDFQDRFLYILDGSRYEYLISLGLKSDSSQVIYSLWKVDDKSTYLFFEKFYQYLATGLTASESLRKTKLYFIDSDDPKLKDPYVWAAFNIIGY